jgi:hypothetical protein
MFILFLLEKKINFHSLPLADQSRDPPLPARGQCKEWDKKSFEFEPLDEEKHGPSEKQQILTRIT